MIAFLLAAGAAVIAALVGVVVMTKAISRLALFQKIKNKWIRGIVAVLVIAAVIFVTSEVWTMENAVVVFVAFFAFYVLCALLAKLAEKIRKKQLAHDLVFLVSVGLSLIYLGGGFYRCNHVFRKEYNLHTNKDVSLKIALIADSHLSVTLDGEKFKKQMDRIEEEQPDILVIAGDFVDDWSKKEDMLAATEALGKMNLKYGVWYAYGNHDVGFYNSRDFSAADLERALEENGVHILSDEMAVVSDKFVLAGRDDYSTSGSGAYRLKTAELLEGADEGKYIVVLDHEPNDYADEAASKADLVLSGHTHGGQLAPFNYFGEWFGVNDKTYGYEKRNNTEFIVTSGISDWNLQFKTGTRSEYVIINIGK